LRKLSVYRIIAAWFLLLVLALPMGIQGLHSWLDKHEQQAHCEQSRGQIHIHDQSYAFDHCFLCAFHFSQYNSSDPSYESRLPGWVVDDLRIGNRSFPELKFYSSGSPRAPPVVA